MIEPTKGFSLMRQLSTLTLGAIGLALGLAGCLPGVSGLVPGPSSSVSPSAAPSGSTSSGFASHVTAVANSGEVSGDLSTGKTMDLSFAAQSSMACWPATENVNFKGNHVLFSTSLPKQSILKITVTPSDPSLDVNVYAMQTGTTNFKIPPEITSAVSCEAGFPQSTDSNPGASDTVSLNATTNPYNVVIGVAGPQGVTSGKFKLKLELQQ